MKNNNIKVIVWEEGGQLLASAVNKQKFVSGISPACDTNAVIDDVIIKDTKCSTNR